MYHFPELGLFFSDWAVSHIEYTIRVSEQAPKIEVTKSRSGKIDFLYVGGKSATIRRKIILMNGSSHVLADFHFEMNRDSVDWFESGAFLSKSDKMRDKMIKAHSRMNNMVTELTTIKAKIGGMSHSWDDEDSENPAIKELKEQRDHFSGEIEKNISRFTSLEFEAPSGEDFISIKDATDRNLITPELNDFYHNVLSTFEQSSVDSYASDYSDDEEEADLIMEAEAPVSPADESEDKDSEISENDIEEESASETEEPDSNGDFH